MPTPTREQYAIALELIECRTTEEAAAVVGRIRSADLRGVAGVLGVSLGRTGQRADLVRHTVGAVTRSAALRHYDDPEARDRVIDEWRGRRGGQVLEAYGRDYPRRTGFRSEVLPDGSRAHVWLVDDDVADRVDDGDATDDSREGRERWRWEVTGADGRLIAQGHGLETPANTGPTQAMRAWVDNVAATTDRQDADPHLARWVNANRAVVEGWTSGTGRPAAEPAQLQARAQDVTYTERASNSPGGGVEFASQPNAHGSGGVRFVDGSRLDMTHRGEVDGRDTWARTLYGPDGMPIAGRDDLAGGQGQTFTSDRALAAWVDFAQAAEDGAGDDVDGASGAAQADLADWAREHNAALGNLQLDLNERELAAGFDEHLDSWSASGGAPGQAPGEDGPTSAAGARPSEQYADQFDTVPSPSPLAEGMTWSPDDRPHPDVEVRRGRPPAMNRFAWHKSQGVEIGANDDGVYWRCPKPGCRVWAGPYEDGSMAKDEAMQHQRVAHRPPLPDPGPVRVYDVDGTDNVDADDVDADAGAPEPAVGPGTCTSTRFGSPHPFEHGYVSAEFLEEWEICYRPADDPIHAAEPADMTAADRCSAGQCSGTGADPGVGADTTGLISAVGYAEAVGAAHAAHGANEGFTGGLAVAQYGQAVIDAVVSARQGSLDAATAWIAVAEVLRAALTVRDAYAAVPDAGDRQHLLTNDSHTADRR